jgi:hypothetical protein
MTHRNWTLATMMTVALAAGAFEIGAQEPVTGAAQSGGGLSEGIKVRGRWVVEIRNPDGTLAARHEFDNSLHAGGAMTLARLLGRDGVPTRWVIQLGRYELASPCEGGTSNGLVVNECFIVDPDSNPRPAGTAVFPTLTTAIGANLTQVVLTGNATALVSGQIQYVATRLGTCLSSTSVTACNNSGGGNYFTVHDLRDPQGHLRPLAIEAGQIVQVTVVLSFS